MQSTSNTYHQLGGHIWDIKTWDDRLKQGQPASGDVIRLVLGILPNGASYVLVPSSRPGARMCRPRADRPAAVFQSLSFIDFQTEVGLNMKLDTYASKRKAKSDTEPRDRSKANTAYTTNKYLTDSGRHRASFEHQRVLCGILRKEYKREHMAELSLKPGLQNVNFRIIALTANMWKKDTRMFEERDKILDVGLTEYIFPHDGSSFTAQSSSDIRVEENRFLGNGFRTVRANFAFGTTQVESADSVLERLQRLFSTPPSDSASRNTLLLVYDEAKLRKALNVIGLDTSEWKSDLHDFLYDTSYPSRSSSTYSSRDWYRTPRRGSSRSRSPRPGTDDRPRPRSPERRSARPEVFLVDVRRLYMTVRRIGMIPFDADTVLHTAKELNVQLDDAGAHSQALFQENEWCAGNDSRLLGAMWHSMARGLTIDEQRAVRWPSDAPAASERLDTPNPNADSDEELDPNDMFTPAGGAVSGASIAAASTSRGQMDWPDDWDSDDDGY
ncbi:uncharacterized protein LAESUDRAFT_810723 [Laetiporus sulphureus 93-53]|uniref:Uncharacterized protein n=1 Tax=Laetiporus sulphureus 93-53 TaxID=1314785 RepID=A0A165G334_9APHY|nr:uncharacterized protein LAESUDRAFT_810723 [Laetiporus sulphureus 93-53]KZT09763.1 hypothetical protein LAESUDRAFT_810723 [Laetiporus sulphureus 93-53]